MRGLAMTAALVIQSNSIKKHAFGMQDRWVFAPLIGCFLAKLNLWCSLEQL